MTHPLTLLTTVTCALLCAASATAQQTEQEPDSPANEERVATWLERQDQDGDGRISRNEASGLMQRNFARNDANQDGVLDGEELRRLSARLARGAAGRDRPQPQSDTPRRRQQGMSTEQLLARAPEGVAIEPDIAYRDGESEAWTLDLVRPEESGGDRRPGIVFIHGGGWRSGDKRTGTFPNGAIEYARRGYVCVTINYRLVDEAPFPACVEDVKNAVRWFRAHADEYNLDPDRIGGYGNSAGAHLVCMLALAGPDAGLEGDGPYQDQSSLLQAVCASATPADLRRPEALERQGREGQFLSGPAETLAERARRASPITYASAAAPPMLLIHGTDDETVNVAQSDRLAETLQDAGATDVTYIRIEGAGHGVFNQHADTTGPAMQAFFDRTIGPGSSRAGRHGVTTPVRRSP